MDTIGYLALLVGQVIREGSYGDISFDESLVD